MHSSDPPTETKGNSTWAVWVVLLGLIVVGAFLRFYRLGALGLAVDEGFQALAVRGALENGLPQLETGWVYLRSWIFIYMQVASSAVLGLDALSLRVPAAFWGVVSIPVAFWFGRSLIDVRAGLLLAAFITLSAWEIEYARYGRFYTLLQVLYMASLVFFYRGFIKGCGWSRVYFFVFYGLAIITHPLSVMLAMCFLVILPLRGYTWQRKAVYFVLCGASGVMWVVLNKVQRGFAKSLSEVAPNVAGSDGMAAVQATSDSGLVAVYAKVRGAFPGLRLPEQQLFMTAWQEHGTMLIVAAALPLLVSAFIVWKMIQQRRWWQGVLLIAIVWCALFQLMALAFVLGVAYAAFFVRGWRDWLRPEVVVSGGAAGVIAFGWIVWFKLSPHASLSYGLDQMLGFPDIHRYFVDWMIQGWPIMLVLLLPVAGLVMMRRAVDQDDECNPCWFVLGAFLVPLVVTSQLSWQFSESRYFFHLYPLMLLMLAVLTCGVADTLTKMNPGWQSGKARAVLTTVVAVLVVVLSQDMNPAKAWSVTNRTYTSHRDPVRSVLNFRWHADFHQDFKTASEQAAAVIEPGDAVVIVGPAHNAVLYRFYLPRVDYIVSPRSNYLSLNTDEAGVATDVVSGGVVLDRAEQLEAIRKETKERGGRLWLFSDGPMLAEDNWYISDAEPALKALVLSWMAEPTFVAQDNKTVVVDATDLDTYKDTLIDPVAQDEQ